MDRLTNEYCSFCKMARHEVDHVKVLEDREVLAFMDLYPATPGHVLVLPKQHIETLYEKTCGLGGMSHDHCHKGGKGDQGEAVS